jgi:HEAT repeat protein
MDFSVTFGRHFSRLVWLLMHDAAVDEQKATLRAMVTISKGGAVTFATRGPRLVVNDADMPAALSGVTELAARLAEHGLRELRVDRGAAASDILGAARAIAAAPATDDAGRAAAAKLDGLGAKSVHAVLAAEAEAAGAGGVLSADSLAGLDPSMELPDAGGDAPPPAPGATLAPAPAPTPEPGPEPTPVPSGGGAFLAFSAAPAPRESLAEIFAELDAARSPNVLTRLLDELATAAEQGAREGRPETVADAFAGIVRREAAEAPDDPRRGSLTMTVRRLSRPTILRVVARMVARRRGHEEEYAAVLARAGEDGAEALIEQLTNAPSLSDRRVYFDTLVRMQAGIPALVHMLGDARWYVVRNGADLLGEMRAADADGPLAELLRHDDERVRRAAAAALGKLGTPHAEQALQQALRDSAPLVRTQAASGLAAQGGKPAAAVLAEALDGEPDAEVQLVMVAALGRIGTSEAVQRLIRIAEPDGRLFMKKPVAQRVAAVQALGEARTPAALNALSHLLDDREKEVRDAAVRVFRAAAAMRAGGGE